MSNSDKPSDETLTSLYQQRKAQKVAPGAIKRQILNQHRAHTQHRLLWRRMGSVALAASTLLLVGLVYWHHLFWQQHDFPLTALRYTTVELHSLATTKQSEAISERYAKHYNDYLKQQQVLALHHKKQGVLAQIENGWQLRTCDQQVVQVSQGLIEALRNIHQIEGTFNRGDNVEVMFDKSGIILGIYRRTNYLRC